MEIYRDQDNDSNVLGYEIGDDYIVVEFKSGKSRFYKYTFASAGQTAILEMHRLARQGDGLGSLISSNQPSYESKW